MKLLYNLNFGFTLCILTVSHGDELDSTRKRMVKTAPRARRLSRPLIED